MASPNEVFKSFSLDQLKLIAKHERIHEKNIDLDLSKKSAVVKAVSKEATDAGVRQLVSLFKLATLKEICEPLALDFTEKNPNHKSVYQKRLKEKMVEMGIAQFLAEYMDEKRLKIFIETFDETPEAKDRKALIDQATRLINFAGISTFLSTFDTTFLQELMSEMKLKCKTDNKNRILEAIAMQTDAIADASSEREEITFSKEKLPIKKGISYQDIFQHYVHEELVEYCRKNELKVSGKKPVLINRILAFLDGDLENTKAINRSEKKEEKKEGKKVKKTEKKKETKKKEEKKEESEKEDEQESDEDEEEEVEEKAEKKEADKQSSPKAVKKSPADSKKKTEEKETVEQPQNEEDVEEEEEAVKEKKDKKTKGKKSGKKN